MSIPTSVCYTYMYTYILKGNFKVFTQVVCKWYCICKWYSNSSRHLLLQIYIWLYINDSQIKYSSYSAMKLSRYFRLSKSHHLTSVLKISTYWLLNHYCTCFFKNTPVRGHVTLDESCHHTFNWFMPTNMHIWTVAALVWPYLNIGRYPW